MGATFTILTYLTKLPQLAQFGICIPLIIPRNLDKKRQCVLSCYHNIL